MDMTLGILFMLTVAAAISLLCLAVDSLIGVFQKRRHEKRVMKAARRMSLDDPLVKQDPREPFERW